MFRTVIVDDDLYSQNAAIEALKEQEDVQIDACFQNKTDFFSYARKHAVDLVFLDIELQRESGFEIAKKLQEEYAGINIIFLTGHASYAIDSFDFQPLFFLTKPISRVKLARALDLLRKKETRKSASDSSELMFKCPKGYRVLRVSEIDYIERQQRKNIVVCGREKFQIANYTMAELMDMLEKYGFFLCHQSYIVSLNRIAEIFDEKKQLYAIRIKDSGVKIPVSRNRYEALRRLTNAETERKL